MLISHKGHTDTIQVYSVTVMTHVKALQAGHSSQGTSEPITPGQLARDPGGLTHCILDSNSSGAEGFISDNQVYQWEFDTRIYAIICM